MPDVAAYLGTKYDILRQQANSDETLKRAQAALTTSQAETNPQEAAAREAQGYGAASQGKGFGAYYSALAETQPSLAASEVGLRGAQGDEASATAAGTRAQTNFLGSGISPELLKLIQGRLGQGGLSKGTSEVDGPAPEKGAATTDTTPAMLTPGEAVLNVGAAEHLGRGTIDVLNAIGQLKMGSSGNATATKGPVTKADKAGAGGIPGYSDGYSDVPGYALGTPNVQNPVTFGTGGASAPSQPKPIDPIAGNGGTWVSQGAGGNNSIRQATGMKGVERLGFADGTSQVPSPPQTLTLSDGKPSSLSMPQPISPADAAGRKRQLNYAEGTSAVPDTSYHNDTVMKARGSAVAGYAKGTSKVPAKGGKPGKDKGGEVTPEMIAKIVSLGKGGGGLTPPGQGSPMPMNMPQLGG